METINAKDREKVESKRQSHTDIQKTKYSIEKIHSQSSQGENRASYPEDRSLASNLEKKDLLKTVRGHERSIQKLQADTKEASIRLIRANEKAGGSASNRSNAENFQSTVKNSTYNSARHVALQLSMTKITLHQDIQHSRSRNSSR